jgi:polyisoprenoid-binding protein YceI
MRLPILFAVALLGAPACAQVRTYAVRAQDSNVGFSVTKWAVFKEEGRFKEFNGTIKFDAGDLSRTAVHFTVKASSIDSRDRDRDDVLRSDSFFDVRKHPELSFRSASAAADASDPSLIRITGDLTIRGTTRRVTIPVKFLGSNRVGDLGELAGFESTFVIDRNDFGMSDMPHLIGAEVTIHLLIGAASS